MYLIAILTLLFSAFFSGIEIAFISANKLQLELDRNSEKLSSRIISFFSKNESDFITTMLVGNNIALVVFGIVMTKILTPELTNHFKSEFSLLFAQTIVTTFFVLVTAEFLPKAIFRIYPNRIIQIFALPICLFFILLRPIAILMLKLSEWVLRFIFHQENKKGKQVFSKTDLGEYLSNVTSKNGVSDNSVEVEMLKNALHLTDKRLRECMIPRTEIIALDVESSIEELKDKFITTKLSKVIIFNDNIDQVIGYVHSSDLFSSPKNIRSVLLPIIYVPESMLAMELLHQFINENHGIALVVDEFGGTSGMVTIEDVTEEIVGEIVDEHDYEEITDIQISENKFRLFARLDVEMVNKKYNLTLPESDEYETIAGLILFYQEDIPVKNDILVIQDFTFTITSVNENSIQEVHLEVNL